MDLDGETQTMTCKDRILNRAIGAIKLKQIDVIRVLMIHREIKTFIFITCYKEDEGRLSVH